MKEKEHSIRRICPCPSYELEGIQTWLEDMAAEGWLLEKDGYAYGFMSFKRSEPCRTLYRLVPLKRRFFGWDNPNVPSLDEQGLYMEYGWKYLTKYGNFFIYRSLIPDPRELHSDPQIQAMSLNMTKFWLSIYVIEIIVLLTINRLAIGANIMGYPLSTPFLIAVTISPWTLIAFTGLLIWLFAQTVYQLVKILQYHKRGQQGEFLTEKKDWKRLTPLIIALKLLPFALLAVLLVSRITSLIVTETRVDLTEYEQDPPFITIADLIPGGEYDERAPYYDGCNTYASWHNALSKDNCQWNEAAKISSSDGSCYRGNIQVSYHETVTPWIAEGLANDYYEYESKRYGNDYYNIEEVHDLGLDSIRAFSHVSSIHLVIRHESTVIYAEINLQDENEEYSWQVWAEAMAEMLLKNAP